jgi:hypothetical protein
MAHLRGIGGEMSISPDGSIRGNAPLPFPVTNPFSKQKIYAVSYVARGKKMKFEHPEVLGVLGWINAPATARGIAVTIEGGLNERYEHADAALQAVRRLGVMGALHEDEARMIASVNILGRRYVILTNRRNKIVPEHVQVGDQFLKCEEKPIDLESFRHNSDLLMYLEQVAKSVTELPDVQGAPVEGGEPWLSELGGEFAPEGIDERLRFLSREEIAPYGMVEVWSADENDGTYWMRIRWLDGVAWEGRTRKGEFASTKEFVRAKMVSDRTYERAEPAEGQLWGVRFRVSDFGDPLACQPLDPEGEPFGQPRSLSRKEFNQQMTRRGLDIFEAVKVIEPGSMVFVAPVDSEGNERGSPKSMPEGVLRSTYVYIEG